MPGRPPCTYSVRLHQCTSVWCCICLHIHIHILWIWKTNAPVKTSHLLCRQHSKAAIVPWTTPKQVHHTLLHYELEKQLWKHFGVGREVHSEYSYVCVRDQTHKMQGNAFCAQKVHIHMYVHMCKASNTPHQIHIVHTRAQHTTHTHTHVHHNIQSTVLIQGHMTQVCSSSPWQQQGRRKQCTCHIRQSVSHTELQRMTVGMLNLWQFFQLFTN